ncbi:diaminopimelate epimerase [Panacibacter ginsenosidivorans]|uniref:Diaminopimelate epimerase n=1 Tax=Panacibacter ginsenosidivorans TaxID=1813871 RepID=A0A5B8VDG6_9BACT|nr:diaminopimelate epimerase [Panacibacter ginsenosidivorans]QEC69577.1 diaminopimelate epimerase [Panacibacter ginsenosidivorans]
MHIIFHKYQGTGNDFVIIDNRNNTIQLSTIQVKKICDRRFGIGADGLMLLNSKEGFDFEMIYFNADGRESSMCGNGGRCLVKFAYNNGIHKRKYLFIAVDGKHEASVEDNGWVYLKMKDVHGIEKHYADSVLDTGSPHYIKPVTDLTHFDVVKSGKDIRYSEEYKKNGINVNFVEQKDKSIFVRTYERGVEDETLSCGTGVTAAALVYAHNDNGFNRVEIKTLGGNLAVEFDKLNDDTFENIWLCGPADFVFKGEIEI